MADLTQTVSNSVNVLGASPCNVWGTLEWGTDNWGPDGFIAKEVEMAVSDSTALASSTQRDVVWYLEYSNTLDIDDELSKTVEIAFSGSLAMTSEIAEVKRQLGEYDYIASRPTTNWIDQVLDQSTIVTDPTDSSTIVTNPTTTWTVV